METLVIAVILFVEYRVEREGIGDKEMEEGVHRQRPRQTDKH